MTVNFTRSIEEVFIIRTRRIGGILIWKIADKRKFKAENLFRRGRIMSETWLR